MSWLNYGRRCSSLSLFVVYIRFARVCSYVSELNNRNTFFDNQVIDIINIVKHFLNSITDTKTVKYNFGLETLFEQKYQSCRFVSSEEKFSLRNWHRSLRSTAFGHARIQRGGGGYGAQNHSGKSQVVIGFREALGPLGSNWFSREVRTSLREMR